MSARRNPAGNERGVAMLLVVAMLAVAAALASAILLSASQLGTGAEKSLEREQARIAAYSMSQAVGDTLVGEKAQVNPDKGDLPSYLYNNMAVFQNGNPWSYYNADEPGQTDLAALTRTFDMAPSAEVAGHVTAQISMYWESEGSFIYGNDASMTTRDRYESVTLTIDTRCTIEGGETYTVRSRYCIVCNGDDPDGTKARWALIGSE